MICGWIIVMQRFRKWRSIRWWVQRVERCWIVENSWLSQLMLFAKHICIVSIVCACGVALSRGLCRQSKHMGNRIEEWILDSQPLPTYQNKSNRLQRIISWLDDDNILQSQILEENYPGTSKKLGRYIFSGVLLGSSNFFYADVLQNRCNHFDEYSQQMSLSSFLHVILQLLCNKYYSENTKKCFQKKINTTFTVPLSSYNRSGRRTLRFEVETTSRHGLVTYNTFRRRGP